MKALFCTALFFVFAPELGMSASSIIRPDPSIFSQITSFTPEWCSGINGGPLGNFRVCYGKSLFRHTTSVRSVLVKLAHSENLYVEDEFPVVELLNPEFGLLGPVNSRSKSALETGKVFLRFDAMGEVEALKLWLPSLGKLWIERP